MVINEDNKDDNDNDVQVHFNEAIRKAVEEKDRRIQELELSLSNQVVEQTILNFNQIKIYLMCSGGLDQ